MAKEEIKEKNKKTNPSTSKGTNSKKEINKEVRDDAKIEIKKKKIKQEDKANKTLYIASIICLLVGVVGGILVGKQFREKETVTEKEVVTEIEEKIETVYSCEFNADDAIVSFNDEDMISNLQLYNTLKTK